ncbi:MAG: hypothetical protein JO022_00905 [Acidobacteriaceae bacterium]|nr:hypothetical protein [Acidobacteriaceae bacterium]
MAVMNQTKTVIGVFDNMADAEAAVRALESAGYSRDDISVIANQTGSDAGDTTTSSTHESSASDVATDAGVGAALGGVGGLLLSFAALAVPGVGPVLAVGPIVAALSGAGIGAVAGGLIGALTESGIPEDEAHAYAEGVRRGHILVSVHTTEDQAERARDVLDNGGAVDVDNRVKGWKYRGWTGYDAGAAPLSADELRREREYFSASEAELRGYGRQRAAADALAAGESLEATQHERATGPLNLSSGSATAANTTPATRHTSSWQVDRDEARDVDETSTASQLNQTGSGSLIDRPSTLGSRTVLPSSSMETAPATTGASASTWQTEANAAPELDPSDSPGRPLIETGSMIGDDVRPVRPDPDNPSNFSDTIDNNRRRPDPATVRVEQGFERAKESAVQSARRMARIYNRSKS